MCWVSQNYGTVQELAVRAILYKATIPYFQLGTSGIHVQTYLTVEFPCYQRMTTGAPGTSSLLYCTVLYCGVPERSVSLLQDHTTALYKEVVRNFMTS